jgi:hypothetical protein
MNAKILLPVFVSQIAAIASAVEFKIERNIPYHSEATLAREGAAAVVECAENLRRQYSAWRRSRGAEKVAAMGEMDDVRERLNALRPDVSRVTVKLIRE